MVFQTALGLVLSVGVLILRQRRKIKKLMRRRLPPVHSSFRTSDRFTTVRKRRPAIAPVAKRATNDYR